MNIGDSIICNFGVNNTVVDTGIDVDRDVIFCEDELSFEIENTFLFDFYEVRSETEVKDSVQGLM